MKIRLDIRIKMSITEKLKTNFAKREDWQDIVRILKKDISGDKKLLYGLTEIEGIDKSMAHSIVKATGLPPDKFIGHLNQEEIQKIEDTVNNPLSNGIPKWQVNRQRDPETGENIHLTGSDWRLKVKMDIRKMKKIGSYRGWRHKLGLPVRGQKTKTTGRTGEVIGYEKKAEEERTGEEE